MKFPGRLLRALEQSKKKKKKAPYNFFICEITLGLVHSLHHCLYQVQCLKIKVLVTASLSSRGANMRSYNVELSRDEILKYAKHREMVLDPQTSSSNLRKIKNKVLVK